MNPGPFTCKANALPLSHIPLLSYALDPVVDYITRTHKKKRLRLKQQKGGSSAATRNLWTMPSHLPAKSVPASLWSSMLLLRGAGQSVTGDQAFSRPVHTWLLHLAACYCFRSENHIPTLKVKEEEPLQTVVQHR